jgi:hypothetical protein
MYQPKNVLARHEAVPGFPTLYLLIFIVVNDFKVRGGFVDIITSHIDSLNIKRIID